MFIRSRSPLRLGLAGGGTDVSPYSDQYGGCVLNATIDMYAHCTLEPTNDNKVHFIAADIKQEFVADASSFIAEDCSLVLHRGVYNHIVKNYNNNRPLSVRITTYADSPIGSGLGTSSTLVVSMLKAFQEWLHLSFGEYDLGHIAYVIEREELGLSGGKQDQFTAAFGGVNFMEFGERDVLVNPLRVKSWVLAELESSLVLYYIGQSRESAVIIDEQIQSAKNNNQTSIEAMHAVKQGALNMKEAILKGDMKHFAQCLLDGWTAKKKMASSISNALIEEVYDFAMQNGAIAAKVSGAGGGGFMMIYCDPLQRSRLIHALEHNYDGKVVNAKFSDVGSQSWRVDDILK